jgi:hypothetical protein
MKEGVKWPSMPYKEFQSRIERAKAIMPKHDLDAMILFAPINWRYYGGWTDVAQMHCDAWRSAMLLTPDKDPVALVHGHSAISTFP